MLEEIKNKMNMTTTENGALTNRSSGSYCLDLFFRAGAMRNASEQEIETAVTRAYAENPADTLKILFFARNIRSGLGERRFFRVAIKALTTIAADAVKRNMKYIPEFGRWDDLLVLIETKLQLDALAMIKTQLDADIKAWHENDKVSLLAKWLPSINTSSTDTVKTAKIIAKYLGYPEKFYRKTLSTLRKYTDIIENRLRTKDYTFNYDRQTSGSMFKYRKAFIRNDCDRYAAYLNAVQGGEKKIHTGTLYPYDIVRKCFDNISAEERKSLDVTWNNLPVHKATGNAITVIDGSGSMEWEFCGSGPRPIDIALSLGIYFAEHAEGEFEGHFITFSENPQLVKIAGNDIYEKVKFCRTFNECSNTNLEAVFRLVLDAAVENHISQEEMPERLFIISDMEFDSCVIGGNSNTLFNTMKRLYAENGYTLPEVVFWNVNSMQENVPVKMTDIGTALVSGCTPAIFDMVKDGITTPEAFMRSVIDNSLYQFIK